MTMKKRLGLACAGMVNSGGADVYGKEQSRGIIMNRLTVFILIVWDQKRGML